MNVNETTLLRTSKAQPSTFIILSKGRSMQTQRMDYSLLHIVHSQPARCSNVSVPSGQNALIVSIGIRFSIRNLPMCEWRDLYFFR